MDMARISTYMYSEGISQMSTPTGSKQVIVSPIQLITSKAIPTNYTFGITFGVIGLDTMGKNHHIKIVFARKGNNDPQKQTVVFEGDINDTSPQPGEILPPDLRGFIGGFVLQNVYLDGEGVFETTIEADGKAIGTMPIEVRKVGA